MGLGLRKKVVILCAAAVALLIVYANFPKHRDTASYCGVYEAGYVQKQRQYTNHYAESGSAAAQYEVGSLYADGFIDPCESDRSVAQDFIEAYFWFSLAANAGEQKAAAARDAAMKHLNPEQLSTVQQRIKNWKPKPE